MYKYTYVYVEKYTSIIIRQYDYLEFVKKKGNINEY